MEKRKGPKRKGLWQTPTILLLLPGCSGRQSALQPAGVDAEQIAQLFWWMAAATLLIWTLVVGIAVYVTRIDLTPHSRRAGSWLIIGGGVVVPTIVLGALLIFGLQLLPSLSTPMKTDLQVAVSGERWWWRVTYLLDSGRTVETANEVRLPVGQQVGFSLTSPDVIHSFWIPSLGGKVDMIPGRTTRLTLKATKRGAYRGACAEYCGTAHALMNFEAVVMDPQAFEAWLATQAEPAEMPQIPLHRRGLTAFLANGCGACHTIRGTPADGRIGPDLTHVGGRLTLGAGILPNNESAFRNWIADPDHIKPGVNMPDFGMLPGDQLAAMAAYLDSLK